MSGRDNRDRAGTISKCPDAVRGDTGDTPFRGGVPVSSPKPPASPAERLHRLSRQVGRLRPNWLDPEAFFEERSEIERELQRMAREARHG